MARYAKEKGNGLKKKEMDSFEAQSLVGRTAPVLHVCS
jgi:hypothetical protein